MPTTRVIEVDPNRPDPLAIAEAARVIRAGGLVAFATETVYGLGADAANPDAVARIFEAKGRPATNPLIVHVESKEAARACVADWPDRAEILADRFWPGPLTLVLPRSAIIPDIVTGGGRTVGVRVPLTPIARWLILEAGRPIAAPSANRSTGLSPTKAAHVLKDLDGQVDLILDSGQTAVGIESTVVDLSVDPPRLLRPGHVSAEQITDVLGTPVAVSMPRLDGDEPARSPGQMDIHYAPRTPAFRLDRDRMPTEPIRGSYIPVIFGEIPVFRVRATFRPNPPVFGFGETGPDFVAKVLYSLLHDFDAKNRDFLLIVPPPDEPRWQAVRDRIWRATKPWPTIY